jgi:hypothetical protein
MVGSDGNLKPRKTDVEGKNKRKEGRDKWKLGAKFNSLQSGCLYYHVTELPVHHFRALVLGKMVLLVKKKRRGRKERKKVDRGSF